jgi:hypothetical protein
MAHVNYPHIAGYMYDCEQCETQCYCGDAGSTACVYCGAAASAIIEKFIDFSFHREATDYARSLDKRTIELVADQFYIDTFDFIGRRRALIEAIVAEARA